MPYGDDVPFILNGMIWASRINDFGERIFGDSIFFLLLEGNHVVAQDQHALYTYHEWRGGQRGIGPLAYHVHLCSPPSFQEHKVEETFHELPFWRVAHFVWMIAWGWRIHTGMMIPNTF